MREQHRRHPPRHGSPLEIFETKFLLAVGQHRQRRAGAQCGRQLRVFFGDVGGIAAARAIDGGDLVDDFRWDLVLARDILDLALDRRQGQADDPLAQRNLGRRRVVEL